MSEVSLRPSTPPGAPGDVVAPMAAPSVDPTPSPVMRSIDSMGFVMDAIAERHRPKQLPAEEDFRSDLEGIKEVCRWTDGYWDFGPGMQRRWNEIQNTQHDVQLLSNYLLMQYKARVWARPT